MQNYLALEKTFSRDALLGDVGGLLYWDMEAIMPGGAAESRSAQLAMLSRLSHELLVTDETSKLLSEAANETAQMDDWHKANLREMQHAYIHTSVLPSDLVEARTKTASQSQHAWIEARKNNDFAAVLPFLTEIIKLEREAGAAKGEALGLSPYDALIDSFDPGGRQTKIDVHFNILRAELPNLIDAAIEKQNSRPPVQMPQGPFPIETQKNLGAMMAAKLGFDLSRGRLDISAHPFAGGASGDVRITTRYDEKNFLSAMMGVFHECGHAIYEQNRPHDWLHQPVGKARGMGVHESQSLIYEKQACRTREFMTYFAPIAREAFKGTGEHWSTENIYRLATKVERGFIRVDSDELTYPAHIIIRYDLEKAMIAGDLQAKDLPGAFNEGVKRMLGLDVPDDTLGCLQDPHWYGGSFGYFPSYTLGAMMAAQLFKAACKAESNLLQSLSGGDFTPLRGWLNRDIHQKASLLSEDDLMVAATGERLNSRIYLDHLAGRYVASNAA